MPHTVIGKARSVAIRIGFGSPLETTDAHRLQDMVTLTGFILSYFGAFFLCYQNDYHFEKILVFEIFVTTTNYSCISG